MTSVNRYQQRVQLNYLYAQISLSTRVYWFSRRIALFSISMFRLFCYVRGDHYQQAFEVKIGKEESVSSLKKAIKEEKSRFFHEIDADSLVLWSYSVSYNKNLKENVERLDLDYDKSLEPLDSLSDIFSSELEKKRVHVVIDRPAPGEIS
jgi:Crinkler effector protein N-terminal domain